MKWLLLSVVTYAAFVWLVATFLKAANTEPPVPSRDWDGAFERELSDLTP